MKNMTKSDRKKIHAALVAAKPLLMKSNDELDKDRFICCAITEATVLKRITSSESTLAREMIMERLRPYNTIQGWLEVNVGYHEVKCAGRNEIQKYRHRWLSSLIKEFST
jgi:hypothetical protein